MGANKFLFGKGDNQVFLLPAMANRHGLVAGATGTGKTISLKVLAEAFSDMGVPVFLADVKGDLSGLCEEGEEKEKLNERARIIGITSLDYKKYPVTFWDVYGEKGIPIRTTLSEMGPLLLSRLLNLNETQEGVLSIVFKAADEKGMLLLDLMDLRAMLKYVGENADEFTLHYGNVSSQSIGAIQRALLLIEDQGADKFFSEPALDINDFFQLSADNRGMINILAADRLFNSPLLYSTFLLWMLSELYENLPEVGDLEKPKFVFFFDEAHLLFKDANSYLLTKIEQVVRLVRSKGVGIYFITQNPSDIPDTVLGQLGNKIQHALRAFTPKDQKAVKSAAESFRANDSFDTYEAITSLAVGEALVSFLDEEGRPSVVEKAFVRPPNSYMGIIPDMVLYKNIEASSFHKKYKDEIDRISAYELLTQKLEASTKNSDNDVKQKAFIEKATHPKTKPARTTDSAFEKMAKSAMTSAGREIGRAVMRGLLGSLRK